MVPSVAPMLTVEFSPAACCGFNHSGVVLTLGLYIPELTGV